MKMALVDPTGTVVGLIDWEVAKTFTPQPGFTLHFAAGCNVGDTWTGQTYTPRKDADNRAAIIAKGRAYLALPTPTQAQTTKAVRALVMLAIHELSDISGI